MKKLKTLLLLIIVSISLFAQVPQTFKYQAVVRDNTGIVLVNKLIAVRTSILKGSISGAVDYSEVHTIATNEFGVISISIGLGTAQSGNFTSINWGNDNYFIKTDVDLNGGNNFTFMGTSQLLSVPYALFAATAASDANDNDTSAFNEIQTLNLNGNNLNISNGNSVPIDVDPINEIQSLNLTANNLSISQGNAVNIDSDPANEIQSLSLTGNSLNISQGNSVNIDTSPTNEIQAISLSNDTLYLSNGGQVWIGKYFQNLSLNGNQLQISNGNSIVLSGVVDLDADPTNELQLLTRSNDTLFLSRGNFVVLIKDFDTDSTNELQNLRIDGNGISISKGDTIYLPPNHDNDSINELQTLQLNGGVLALSKSNSINLPDSSVSNELQSLSVVGDSLKISQGNSVFIGNNFNYNFPDGLNDLIPVIRDSLQTNPFSPPSGYNLYITEALFSSQSQDQFRINQNQFQNINDNGNTIIDWNLASPIIVNPNDIVDDLDNYTTIVGFLVPKKYQSEIIALQPSVNTVIQGTKNFYLTFNSGDIQLNSKARISKFYGLVRTFPIILKPGDVLRTTGSGVWVNGYYK